MDAIAAIDGVEICSVVGHQADSSRALAKQRGVAHWTTELAESLARMHAPSLELLGKRVAHVLGRDDLKPSDNPLSPAVIAANSAPEIIDTSATLRNGSSVSQRNRPPNRSHRISTACAIPEMM